MKSKDCENKGCKNKGCKSERLDHPRICDCSTAKKDKYELDANLCVCGDVSVAGKLKVREGIDMCMAPIKNLRDPIFPLDGVNKNYVDGLASANKNYVDGLISANSGASVL